MSTRDDLEAALAHAQADWRRASDEFDQAQASLSKANANWDKFVEGRRQAESDRRKAQAGGISVGEIWNWIVNDRRTAQSERRAAKSKFFDFSRDVASRHEAYMERSNAEAKLAEASANLIAAINARQKARAALDELNCVQTK